MADAVAELLLGTIVLVRRQPLPRGRALAGVYVEALLHIGKGPGKATERAEVRPEMAGAPADCVRCV